MQDALGRAAGTGTRERRWGKCLCAAAVDAKLLPKGGEMLVRSVGVLLLFAGCAYANYMSRSDESSFTAALASPPPYPGSPVRIDVRPTLTYSRSVSWDDIGHPYGISRSTEASDGISIEVTNQTAKTIWIDWERSTLVDSAGHPRRVVHLGGSAGTPDKPQASTVLEVGASTAGTLFPADAVVLADGSFQRKIYLPTQLPGEDVELSLQLAVVVDGTIVTVPQPIAVHVMGTTTTTKVGDKWPRRGFPCQPLVGCGKGLVCMSLSSDFRCVLER